MLSKGYADIYQPEIVQRYRLRQEDEPNNVQSRQSRFGGMQGEYPQA